MVKEKKYYWPVLLGLLLLVGLWATSLYSYLLFHSIAELFSIIVACGIFMLAWNSRQFTKNDYLLFIGIAYLFIGALDLTHTLAYKGMGIFQGYHANLSTQLWIAARYVESASLLIAPLLVGRKLKTNFVFLGYIIATTVLLGSILYWHVFPVCFIEGEGLTIFKKVSEYIISFILIASVVVFFNKRKEFERDILRLLIASIVVTIVSELAFTLYADSYGHASLIGHYLKFVSFYLIYVAVIRTGLTRPFALLFRDLKQSEDTLRAAEEYLELEVGESSEKLQESIKQLHESELCYRSVVEDSPGLICRFEPGGIITFVNDAYCRYSGKDQQELVGSSFFSLIPEADREGIAANIAALTPDAPVQTHEHRVTGPDGQIRWQRWMNQAMFDKDGRVMAYQFVGENITERKRLEESLRRREAILQAVAYAAEHFLKAPSWEDDVDLVLARLGQASEASRVYVFENHTDAAGELLASQRYEWVAPGVIAQLDNPDMRGISWRSGAMRRAAEILRSGGCVSGHVRDFLPAEQDMMSAQDIQSMVVVPIFADDEWWGFMGFDECLCEREWYAAEIDALKAGASTLGAAIQRKRAEERLRESEEEYMTMIEYSNDMIWTLDKKGNFTYFNKKSEEITGYKIKEQLNKGFLPIILEEDLEMVYDVFRRALQGKPLHYEVRIHDASRKKLITLSVNTAPIYKDKEIIGTVSFGRDITERKQAEEEIKRLRDEYTHIARVSAMGELVASLAHELKQPLAAIRSNAQAAQRFLTGDKPDIDELHEVLKDIIKDNRRADDVIEKLRALMRKSGLQITELNINNVVQNTLPLINSYEIMRNISLKLELDKNIPHVNGDRIQLQQVILNLILNSTEALMDAEVKLRTIVVRTNQEDTQNVTLSVKDNGPGIEEKAMSHLFDPFYTTKKEGLGMGLAISRTIIEEHRGSLWAENNPDSGATFYFTIPIAKGASA
jgi:PAS domain S-box-containing protein